MQLNGHQLFLRNQGLHNEKDRVEMSKTPLFFHDQSTKRLRGRNHHSLEDIITQAVVPPSHKQNKDLKPDRRKKDSEEQKSIVS
jgi:hypothetical protein